MNKKIVNPNIAILGASGGVCGALLQYLTEYRLEFGNLLLVDKTDKVLHSPYLNHSLLNYNFVNMHINGHIPIEELAALLTNEKINILLDLTDSDTLPILELADKLGINYINSSINVDNIPVAVLTKIITEDLKSKLTNASHIIGMGMNPGIVNIWVEQGIKEYGIPNEIIELEYDSAICTTGWRPMVTWSKKQFLNESIWDPTGRTVANGVFEELQPNALMNTVSTKRLLKPLVELDEYPKGMIVYHEEMMTLGQKYKIPAQFIYAINPQTIAYLQAIYKKNGTVDISEIELGDNTELHIKGSDLISIILKYDDKSVYYYNEMLHEEKIGVNATLRQVAIGVLTGLRALIHNQVKQGLNYPEDLDSNFITNSINTMMITNKLVLKRSNKQILAPTIHHAL